MHSRASTIVAPDTAHDGMLICDMRGTTRRPAYLGSGYAPSPSPPAGTQSKECSWRFPVLKKVVHDSLQLCTHSLAGRRKGVIWRALERIRAIRVFPTNSRA
eukprot:203888-Rhodomonas_salina.2